MPFILGGDSRCRDIGRPVEGGDAHIKAFACAVGGARHPSLSAASREIARIVCETISTSQSSRSRFLPFQAPLKKTPTNRSTTTKLFFFFLARVTRSPLFVIFFLGGNFKEFVLLAIEAPVACLCVLMKPERTGKRQNSAFEGS